MTSSSTPTPSTALEAALSGELRSIDGTAGRVAYYAAEEGAAADSRPLLLVHSVNAAASAYEMRPLFEHYRRERAVYALDLPGYGQSERGDRPYSPRLMTDAVLNVIDTIRHTHPDRPVDLMALSLGCEFAARAAIERRELLATLALISPTGFDGTNARRGAAGSTLAMPALYRTVTLPVLDRALFALLTSRLSIRYFLRKTFGSADVDSALVDYAYTTAHQPGARYAPYRFLSGFLFSGDVFSVYESLELPVWLAHGVRGDFQDYRLTELVAARENWTVQVFDSGALPHFEQLASVVEGYDRFVSSIRE